ncbi:MAG: hypothetical protein M1827_004588 [Pycnora praestabilis]|nr:MAG: hypothetical protein M1827_004588 [Pycnora praestabilis]
MDKTKFNWHTPSAFERPAQGLYGRENSETGSEDYDTDCETPQCGYNADVELEISNDEFDVEAFRRPISPTSISQDSDCNYSTLHGWRFSRLPSYGSFEHLSTSVQQGYEPQARSSSSAQPVPPMQPSLGRHNNPYRSHYGATQGDDGNQEYHYPNISHHSEDETWSSSSDEESPLPPYSSYSSYNRRVQSPNLRWTTLQSAALKAELARLRGGRKILQQENEALRQAYAELLEALHVLEVERVDCLFQEACNTPEPTSPFDGGDYFSSCPKSSKKTPESRPRRWDFGSDSDTDKSEDTDPQRPDSQQARASLDNYNTAWDSTSSTSPSIPWPTSDLSQTSLKLRFDFNRDLKLWSDADVMRWNAFSFFVRAHNAHPDYERKEGMIGPFIFGSDDVSKVQLREMKQQTRNDMFKWHPDKLTQRKGGKDLVESEEAKAVYYAIVDLANLCDEKLK